MIKYYIDLRDNNGTKNCVYDLGRKKTDYVEIKRYINDKVSCNADNDTIGG